MDNSFNEFEGTELDPSVDYEWEDEEGNDLLPIIGASAAVAAVAGGLLVLAGRRRNPTPQERIEDIVQEVQSRGKKGAKVVGSAIEGAHLGDLLSDAMDKARDLSGNAVSAAQDAGLGDLLDDAISRSRKAITRLDIAEAVGSIAAGSSKDLRKRLRKTARKVEGMHIDAAVGEALKKARHAAENIDVADTAGAVRKTADSVVDNVRHMSLDRDSASGLLDGLKEKLVQTVESMRDDIAPKALDAAQHAAGDLGTRVREDVLPAAQSMAQDAIEKVREDVLPAASDRVSQFVSDNDLDKKARKLASSAKSNSGSLPGLTRSLALGVLRKVVDELLPDVRNAGMKAAQATRDDIAPAAVNKLREDVLPKLDDAATFARHRAGEVVSQAPDVLGDLLKMARERVEDVIQKSEPLAADALDAGKARLSDLASATKDGAGSAADLAGDAAEYARHRASELAEFARHRADDVAGSVQHHKGGVTGAISTASHNVTGAVGTAAGATANATREATGILFWLAMLGGLILLVFVPDRDRQKELWNTAQQFLGELREMWQDLQGSDFEELPEAELKR